MTFTVRNLINNRSLSRAEPVDYNWRGGKSVGMSKKDTRKNLVSNGFPRKPIKYYWFAWNNQFKKYITYKSSRKNAVQSVTKRESWWCLREKPEGKINRLPITLSKDLRKGFFHSSQKRWQIRMDRMEVSWHDERSDQILNHQRYIWAAKL